MSADALCNLGTTMTATERFDVNGVWMTQQQCYCEAAELDPRHSHALNNLGTTLSASGSIDVNGVSMTRQQCYRKAAELDPRNVNAFFNLGTMLNAGESIDVNGVSMTQQQCYRKAAELDPRDAAAFLYLGESLSAGASTEVNGVSMTQQQCYRKAAELAPRCADAFYVLGATLGTGECIDINGVTMTRQQCYRKAVEIDPRHSYALFFLGTTLSAGESIDVNGVSMTEQQCYRNAAEIDSRNAIAFCGLGATLNTTRNIDVNGVSMTERDCYQKALEIDPDYTFAQNALQRLDRAEVAIVVTADMNDLPNRHRWGFFHRRPRQPNHVDHSRRAGQLPARGTPQRGSGIAGARGSAAPATVDIARRFDARQEAANLPLTAVELAEAMRLQRQHDTRQPAPVADITSSALSWSSALSALHISSAPRNPTRLAASIATPATLVRQNWTFAETEEHAQWFNRFQARLDETADYVNVQLRPDLIGRVNALVTAMRESPALRRTCFAIAQGAILGCGDAISLGLNEMALAKIGHDAQAGGDDIGQLRALGEGFFKLHVLNELVNTEITRRRNSGISMDEVEIRLAYQVALRTRLDLPGVAQSMRFVRSANVTQTAIDAAAAEVERRLQGSASVEFLVQWTPWQQAMERANPQAYAATRRVHQEDRDAIALQPPRTTEGEWLGALAAQAAREIADIQRITKRLTWAILESS